MTPAVVSLNVFKLYSLISLGLLLEPGEHIVLGPLFKLVRPRGLPRRDRPIVEEFLKTHGEKKSSVYTKHTKHPI
ncbi:MAG: hypothetical protein DRJ63_10650 [Thermoprotei archaeon]|nr:MAG: hypothetical protein DRJ63_10650 [Thermoprotei archaeon]